MKSELIVSRAIAKVRLRERIIDCILSARFAYTFSHSTELML